MLFKGRKIKFLGTLYRINRYGEMKISHEFTRLIRVAGIK